MTDSVLVEQRGDATWITLNRPDRRNAYDPEMAEEIVLALEGATRSRAVVITGVARQLLRRGRARQPVHAGRHQHARALPRLAAAVRRDPQLPAAGDRRGERPGRRRRQRAGHRLRPGDRGGVGHVRADGPAGRQRAGHRRHQRAGRADRREAGQGDGVPVPPVLGRAGARARPGELRRPRRRAGRCRRGADRRAQRASPRYLEIAKVSSNVWWNAARDSFATGLGMLVQSIGSPDMAEGAQAFLEKRTPQFPAPDA